MKLDTSSYYPESPLDRFRDDDETAKNPDSSDKSVQSKPSETPGHPPVHNHADKDGDPFGVTVIDFVCKVLSWVLVPLMMPVYGIITIFTLSLLDHSSESARIVFTLVIFCFNALLPALLILLLKKMGYVDDIGLNGQKERLIPYIITIVSMGGTAAFMAYKGAPMWVSMFFAGGALAGLINLLINFRWKISAHSAAIAGMVALLLRIIHDGWPRPEIYTWLIVWIALSGLLGSARVWMGRHTVAQVLAGYVVGFCTVFFLTMIG